MEEHTGLNHNNVIEMSYRLKTSWLYPSLIVPDLYFLHRNWSPISIHIKVVNGKLRPSVPLMNYEEKKVNKLITNVELKAVG